MMMMDVHRAPWRHLACTQLTRTWTAEEVERAGRRACWRPLLACSAGRYVDARCPGSGPRRRRLCQRAGGPSANWRRLEDSAMSGRCNDVTRAWDRRRWQPSTEARTDESSSYFTPSTIRQEMLQLHVPHGFVHRTRRQRVSRFRRRDISDFTYLLTYLQSVDDIPLPRHLRSPPPCQISPPSVQRVAPVGRKTSKSASE